MHVSFVIVEILLIGAKQEWLVIKTKLLAGLYFLSINQNYFSNQWTYLYLTKTISKQLQVQLMFNLLKVGPMLKLNQKLWKSKKKYLNSIISQIKFCSNFSANICFLWSFIQISLKWYMKLNELIIFLQDFGS